MANQESSKLAEPGVGALDDPAAFIAPKPSDVPVPAVFAVAAVRDNEFDAALFEPLAQRVGVVGAVGNHAFGLLPRTVLGARTLTSASVDFATVTSPGEALSSRTPSGRPPTVDQYHPLRALAPIDFADCGAPFDRREAAVQEGLFPPQQALAVERAQQRPPGVEPYPLLLPLLQPSPAGRRRGILVGQKAPCRAGLQHPQNPLQTGPVRRPGPAPLVLPPPARRQQRLN